MSKKENYINQKERDSIDMIGTIEQFEISKKDAEGNTKPFYYTGTMSVDSSDPSFIWIETVRGERLRFRREQLQGSKKIRCDKNEKRPTPNK